jgi:hypothetical protein
VIARVRERQDHDAEDDGERDERPAEHSTAGLGEHHD